MTISKGMEGVVVSQTGISFIDGLEGVLSYRGYSIQDLAENSSFEEVIYLLWHGELPSQEQFDDLNRRLRAERGLPNQIFEMMRLVPPITDPMAVLRTFVSALAEYDEEANEASEEARRRKAIRLTARIPTIVAAWQRMRKGKDPISPDEELGHAGNFLYMMNGEKPSVDAARALDIALILHADHGFNASTFAARVTTATESDLYSAITSAVGTLKGPLHGGANAKVMEMLEQIGSLENVEPWIERKLAAKEKIMGFGHRVYKTIDPRAKILREMSRRLSEEKKDPYWFEMSERIMNAVKESKGLDPNVDFFSASTYHYLGIPKDLFTPIFAISRVAGWTAHVMEQRRDNRLIRPRAEYVGPKDLTYAPIAQR